MGRPRTRPLSETGKRIQSASEHCGITIPQLAAAAGIHASTLYRIMLEETETPRFDTKQRIAEVLGCAAAELFRDTQLELNLGGGAQADRWLQFVLDHHASIPDELERALAGNRAIMTLADFAFALDPRALRRREGDWLKLSSAADQFEVVVTRLFGLLRFSRHRKRAAWLALGAMIRAQIQGGRQASRALLARVRRAAPDARDQLRAAAVVVTLRRTGDI